MLSLAKIFKTSVLITIFSLSVYSMAGEKSSPLTEAKELFKAREYKKVSIVLQKILPDLKGYDKSKAMLYLAYSLEKQKKHDEAVKIFREIADNRSFHPRHRTEALLAYAEILKKTGKDPVSVYKKLLKVSGGHPKHREKAANYLNAHKPTTTFNIMPQLPDGFIKNDKFYGFKKHSTAILFDSKSGLPLGFWGGEGKNILVNFDYKVPLWKIHFLTKENKKITLDTLDTSNVEFAFVKDKKDPELNIIYTASKGVASAVVMVKIKCPAPDRFVTMSISVKNNSKALRLWELDFPKLAIRPLGKAENNQVVYPWRRGRLRKLEKFSSPTYQEYPGSSARFQFVALSCPDTKKSIYFASLDSGGSEKIFREFFNPGTGNFELTVTQFPSDRGLAGNNANIPYAFKLGCFEGDWYNAARIYRKWWQQQPWAARGPLAINKDVPEWLKKSPVFLRFYLRTSRGLGINENLKNALKWAEFLEKRPTPATLYHYSEFKEPENRKNYPVAEYYGYCAPPYPGLQGFLRKLKNNNIHSNVYLQSEIFNQDYTQENTKYLKPTLRVDINGKPRLYVNERWIACRQSKRWRKRQLEMIDHLLNMGFEGIYMDTFGKSKINHECFNTEHGHPCGGGNIDCAAQRGMGKEVKKFVKDRNKDFYIGGEACVEAFPDILDYKLNATNVYKDMVNVERVLYGDYFLSHGRVVRGNDEKNDNKIIAMDFISGVIPGRYYCSSKKSVPRTKIGRDFLKKAICYTESAVDYLRTGEMLHPLEFFESVPKVKVVESIRQKKIELPALKNAVYRSWKDKSIGIAVINIADEELENQLILPKASQWQVSPDAKIYEMIPDGKKSLVGSLSKIKKLKIKLPSDGIAFYIVSNK